MSTTTHATIDYLTLALQLGFAGFFGGLGFWCAGRLVALITDGKNAVER